MRGRPRRPRLTPEQRAEKDARQQHWLNLLMIQQVAEATFRSGWYTVPYSDFEQMPVEDYGDRMVVEYEDGSRFEVRGFEPETLIVHMRKVA